MTPERWRAITGIFHQAIARAAPEREAYLARACQADPSMRPEVEAMIAAHEDDATFGDSLVGASGTPNFAPARYSAPTASNH